MISSSRASAWRCLRRVDLGADAVAGDGAAHEDDEVVDAADPLAAVGQGVDAQVEDVTGPGRHRGSVARPAGRRRTGAVRAARLSTRRALSGGRSAADRLLECLERRHRRRRGPRSRRRRRCPSTCSSTARDAERFVVELETEAYRPLLRPQAGLRHRVSLRASPRPLHRSDRSPSSTASTPRLRATRSGASPTCSPSRSTATWAPRPVTSATRSPTPRARRRSRWTARRSGLRAAPVVLANEADRGAARSASRRRALAATVEHLNPLLDTPVAPLPRARSRSRPRALPRPLRRGQGHRLLRPARQDRRLPARHGRPVRALHGQARRASASA